MRFRVRLLWLFAGLCALLARGAAAEEDIPEIIDLQATDCEGNFSSFLTGGIVTTTGIPSLRISVRDPVNGLRFGNQPHLGGASGLSAVVLHLKFAAGSPFTDSSLHGNNGTNTNTTQVAGPNADFAEARNWAVAGDNIQINKSPTLNATTNQLTVEAWIRPANLTQAPIFEWNNGTNLGVHLWHGFSGNAGELFANFIDTVGASHQVRSSPGFVQAGVWQHVAMTYGFDSAANNKFGNLYHNGVLIASAAFQTETPILQTSFNAFVGRRPSGGGATFVGDIDEVRVATRALTSLALANDYHGGLFEYSTSTVGGAPTFRVLLATNTGGHYTPTNPGQGVVTVVTATIANLPLANGGIARVEYSFQDRGGATVRTVGRDVTINTGPPAAPSNLTATPLTPNSIRYDWSKPTKICLISGAPGRYNLYDENSVLQLGNEPGLSAIQGGLGVNSLVRRGVSAFDDFGESSITPAVSAYTHANPPGPASAGSISTGSFVLDWGDNSNPSYTRWEVSRWTDDTFTTQQEILVPIASDLTTSARGFGGLTPATTFYLRVRAKNGRNGDFGLGDAFTGYVNATATTLPAAPGTLGAVALGASSVTWSWSAVPSAQSYTLESPPGTTLATTNALSVTQSGLGPNQLRSGCLKTTNASGTGACGSTVFVHTAAVPPTGTAITGVSTGTVSAQWDTAANPGGTSFEAQLSTAANFVPLSQTRSTTGNSASFSDLVPGGTYYVRVRARNGDSLPTGFDAAQQAVTQSLSPHSSAATPLSPYAPRANTAAAWHFDASSGTAAQDSSGSGNHATLSSTDPGISTPTFVPGLAGLGNAVEFPGISNTLARAGHTASLGTTGSLSVEAWVHPNTTNQTPGAAIVAKGSGTALSFALDLTGSGGKYRFTVSNAGFGAQFSISSTQTIAANRWTHLAGVYDAATPAIKVLVDGVLSSSTTAAPGSRGNDTHELTIGARQAGSGSYDLGFRGRIDEVHLLTVALTDAQIGEDYRSGLPASLTLPFPNDDVSLTLPPNTFGQDALVLISSDPLSAPLGGLDVQVLSDSLAAPPTGQSLVPGSVRQIIANIGGNRFTGNFGSSVTVSLPYNDADANQLVDGTSPPLPAASVRMYTLDEAVSGNWVPLATTVDLANRRVLGQAAHFSIFALFGPSGIKPDLQEVRIYPSPWKPGSGGRFDSVSFAGNTGLAFDNLPVSGTARIFTLSGELVVSLRFSSFNAGTLIWDGRNHAGRPVASGVYFAYVKADDGSNFVQKFAVER